MLYITGDCHGDFSRFSEENFPEQKNMTKEDYVLICGDFGYYYPEEGFENELKKLSEKNFTTLFIDGNHEDFDRLYALPMSTWHEGLVHIVVPGIIHLMRGEYYENVSGRNILTFGGAKSGDKAERTEHKDWWEEEEPSKDEFIEAVDSLELHGNRADIIVSHECPNEILDIYSNGSYEESVTSGYLSELRNIAGNNYNAWYFGHHHHDIDFNEKDHMVYERIIKLA